METWLQDKTEALYHLPGYNFISAPRKNNRRGGVGVYLKDAYKYTVRNDICKLNATSAEILPIEIIIPNSQNVIIIIMYKPPDSPIRDFSKLVEDVATLINLESAKSSKKLFMLVILTLIC